MGRKVVTNDLGNYVLLLYVVYLNLYLASSAGDDVVQCTHVVTSGLQNNCLF